MRAIPGFFGPHGRTRATCCDLDPVANYARDCQRDQHRQKNAYPFFATAQPCDSGKNEPEREVFRPITESAHVEHGFPHRLVLMLRDEISRGAVQTKRRRDENGGNHETDQPIKNRAALHK